MDKTPQGYLPGKHEGTYRVAVLAIISTGILLRVFHYFDNRSLWEDEIYLSTGLVKLGLADLFTHTLDFQQKAPIGYTVIVKLCLMLFGNNEMALRLFPFLCGITSVLIFLPVARYFLRPAGVIAAMAIFALSPPLIYHSVEAKQYSTELLATVIILWLYTRYHHNTDSRPLIRWGIAGAVIVWFSYSSVFILAGITLTTGIACIVKKRWSLLFKLAIVFMVWLGSFVISYLAFSQKNAHAAWLVFFFAQHDAFMPLSAGAVQWMGRRIISFFNYPLGLSWSNVYAAHSALKEMLVRMAFMPVFFSIAGVYYLYRTKKKLLLLIVLTFGIVFLASAVRLYPFHERLTVFLAPLIIILLGAGCDAVFTYSNSSKVPVWQTALVALLLFGPVKNTIAQAIHPRLFGDYKKSYQREALLYLQRQYRPGDLVYVYWNDLPGYELYKSMYGFKFDATEGADHRHDANSFDSYFAMVDSDLNVFKGRPRVWVVQHNAIDIPIGDFIGDPAYYYAHNDGPKRFYDDVRQLGREREHFQPADAKAQTNIDVSLIDFSGK